MELAKYLEAQGCKDDEIERAMDGDESVMRAFLEKQLKLPLDKERLEEDFKKVGSVERGCPLGGPPNSGARRLFTKGPRMVCLRAHLSACAGLGLRLGHVRTHLKPIESDSQAKRMD